MKTILVPTDFSETANHALEVASQLAKKNNAKLVMLHMLEIPEHIMPSLKSSNDVNATHNTHQSDIPEAIFYMKLAHKRFEEIKTLPFLEGVNYEEAVQNHLNFKGIIESAHKHDADLIVMGSHGASGLKETFVGSHTEKVVRTSDIPVLVIKEKCSNFEIKNFLFACNLEEENTKALHDANSLAEKLGATLHLVYVNTSGREFLTTEQTFKKFNTLIDNSRLNNEKISISIYNDISVEQGMLNFGKRINADLIGIPTHGRRGLAHFINHSLSEDVVNHSSRPVITFKI